MSDDLTDLIKSLCTFVAENAWKSGFEFPPQTSTWSVDAHELLDHIAEKTGTTKEQLGTWVAEALAKAKEVHT